MGLISIADWLNFFFRSDTLNNNFRDSDFSLAIPQPQTNYWEKVFHKAELYCGLPLDIRQSLSLDVFKSNDFNGRFT